MRILLVSSSSGSRGGGEIFLLTLAQELLSLGHSPELWAAEHSRMDELCGRFGEWGPVHRFPYRNTYDRRSRLVGALLDTATANRIAAKWRELKPDIIHLNKQNLEDGLDLVAAARKCGRPGVMTLHVTQTARELGARLGTARDFLTRSALRNYPGALVAIGRSRLADLRNLLGDDPRLRLVENGVPIPSDDQRQRWRTKIRAELGLTDSNILGLAVGRMVDQKRPDLFLRLAEQLQGRISDTRFLWVGGGKLEQWWKAELARRRLDQQIRATGWVTDPQPYYAAADFLLHTAAFEGLPLALLEAAAWGLPIAVTKNLFTDLDFLPEMGALVAEPTSPDWGERLAHSAFRAELGSRARSVVIARFSSSLMAQKYVSLYEEAR